MADSFQNREPPNTTKNVTACSKMKSRLWNNFQNLVILLLILVLVLHLVQPPRPPMTLRSGEGPEETHDFTSKIVKVILEKTTSEVKVNQILDKPVFAGLANTGKKFLGERIREFPPMKRAFTANRLPLTKIDRRGERACAKWAVLTTVFSPSEAVRQFAYRPDWCVVVVGDHDLPAEPYVVPTTAENNVFFLDRATQQRLKSAFVDSLPWRSFGRKNVGFLYAVARGAEVIWDFDDDNMLKFWMAGATPDENLEVDRFADLLTSPNGETNQSHNCTPFILSRSDSRFERGMKLKMPRKEF